MNSGWGEQHGLAATEISIVRSPTMNHIPEGVSAQSLPVGLCSRGILQICVLQCKNDNGKKKS